MGGAIVEGLLKSDVVRCDDITVCDHNQPVMDHFAGLGTITTSLSFAATALSDVTLVPSL